LSGGGNVEGK
jgi:hypothetical protein